MYSSLRRYRGALAVLLLGASLGACASKGDFTDGNNMRTVTKRMDAIVYSNEEAERKFDLPSYQATKAYADLLKAKTPQAREKIIKRVLATPHEESSRLASQKIGWHAVHMQAATMLPPAQSVQLEPVAESFEPMGGLESVRYGVLPREPKPFLQGNWYPVGEPGNPNIIPAIALARMEAQLGVAMCKTTINGQMVTNLHPCKQHSHLEDTGFGFIRTHYKAGPLEHDPFRMEPSAYSPQISDLLVENIQLANAVLSGQYRPAQVQTAQRTQARPPVAAKRTPRPAAVATAPQRQTVTAAAPIAVPTSMAAYTQAGPEIQPGETALWKRKGITFERKYVEGMLVDVARKGWGENNNRTVLAVRKQPNGRVTYPYIRDERIIAAALAAQPTVVENERNIPVEVVDASEYNSIDAALDNETAKKPLDTSTLYRQLDDSFNLIATHLAAAKQEQQLKALFPSHEELLTSLAKTYNRNLTPRFEDQNVSSQDLGLCKSISMRDAFQSITTNDRSQRLQEMARHIIGQCKAQPKPCTLSA